VVPSDSGEKDPGDRAGSPPHHLHRGRRRGGVAQERSQAGHRGLHRSPVHGGCQAPLYPLGDGSRGAVLGRELIRGGFPDDLRRRVKVLSGIEVLGSYAIRAAVRLVSKG
jgi:hypothetical protein